MNHFSYSIRIIEKNIIFNEENIKNSNFYRNKKPFIIDDIDVNKILIFKKYFYGKKSSLKYFIGYHDDNIIRPFCIKLPQMIGCVKCFENNKTMSFKVIDKGLLEGYIKIWERINNLIGK